MIATILTVFGVEQSVTTAVTFNGAKVLRVYNSNVGDVLVTIANAGVTQATLTVKGGDTVFIEKNPNETIACASACKVVPVGY